MDSLRAHNQITHCLAIVAGNSARIVRVPSAKREVEFRSARRREASSDHEQVDYPYKSGQLLSGASSEFAARIKYLLCSGLRFRPRTRITVRLLSSYIRTAFVTASLFFLASTALAQNANPLEGDPRAIFAGGALFRAQCATCHGADAKGISSIDAPDLTMIWSARELAARDVYNVIRDGVPGSIMPPHGMTDTELWMLVAFLQSVAVEGVIGLPAGNISNGERLFAQNCRECHRVAGEGGSLGPNLSGITRRRSLESLNTSVREPSVLIGRGYKPVTVVTGNNERIVGVLKSEDAFSLQLLDQSQRLRGFMKADLQSVVREDSSLMPAFGSGQLAEQELIDILNYLDSL